MKSLLLIFIIFFSFQIQAQKLSLSRAEKFYTTGKLLKAENEILKAIKPPYSSMEEWAKALNYYLLIKADLYCTEELISFNLHEVNELIGLYSKCKRIDTANFYVPNLRVKMESVGDLLLKIANSEYEKKQIDSYLTKMDYYILLSDLLGNNNDAHYKHLASVSASSNHYGRAINYWKKMLQAGHEVEHAYKEMIALLYGLNEFDEVDKYLVVGKEKFPENTTFIEFEILRLIDKDIIFGAKQLAEKTIDNHPYNANIVFLLGILNKKLNNHESALDSFLDVASNNETHIDTHIEIGKLFLDSNEESDGNLILAKHYLEVAENLHPKNEEILSLLRITYGKLKDEENLKRVLDKIVTSK